MILYAKHLGMMTLALTIIPILALFFARVAGAKYRLRRPGLTVLTALYRIGIALLVPLIAQGSFALLGHRMISLAIAGAVYGVLFGDPQDYPPIPSALWGALGGIAAAVCFGAYPPSNEARSLCVAVFAVMPLLAYRPVSVKVRSKLAASGMIVPTRRVLR